MTIIKDPLLEPFYIGKDSHCYTAYEVITPDPKYTENGKTGEDYTKPLGHYSNFGSALRAIMKAKLNVSEKEYTSVKEYITEWNKIQNKIENLTEFNQL